MIRLDLHNDVIRAWYQNACVTSDPVCTIAVDSRGFPIALRSGQAFTTAPADWPKDHAMEITFHSDESNLARIAELAQNTSHDNQQPQPAVASDTGNEESSRVSVSGNHSTQHHVSTVPGFAGDPRDSQ